MKKLVLLSLALCATVFSNAQIAKVSAPQPILKGTETNLYNPVLSKDGNHLLFSDANYTNVRSFDFETGVVEKLNFDKRQALVAHFDDNNKIVATQNTKVRTEGSTLYINVNGTEKAYSPVESFAGYLWESLSPDGTKVMFVAAGKGVIITDLNGKIIAQPGKFEAPVWFGNDHIIVQKSTDDGHQYSSSQILIMNLDGTQAQAITKPESLTFAPAASFEANRLVYSTIDGRLFQVNISLN